MLVRRKGSERWRRATYASTLAAVRARRRFESAVWGKPSRGHLLRNEHGNATDSLFCRRRSSVRTPETKSRRVEGKAAVSTYRAVQEQLDVPPIWLMREAGRYLPEYSATRSEAGNFLKAQAVDSCGVRRS